MSDSQTRRLECRNCHELLRDCGCAGQPEAAWNRPQFDTEGVLLGIIAAAGEQIRAAVVPEVVAVVATPEDDKLVAMWLHGRAAATVRKYREVVGRFRLAVLKPLALIGLDDLQAYSDTLAHLAKASRRIHLAAIKSLLAFGAKLRILPFDVGAALRVPGRAEMASVERYLEPEQVRDMIRLEPELERRLALGLLYYAGLRVGELVGLRWCDVLVSGETGQITVTGKGDKVRPVVLSAKIWPVLLEWRALWGPGVARGPGPVFPGEGTKAIDVSTVRRWVYRAAGRVPNLDARPSPHWLRHAHAWHSLEGGAPLKLVSETLGHSHIGITGIYLHSRPGTSSGTYL